MPVLTAGDTQPVSIFRGLDLYPAHAIDKYRAVKIG